MVRSHSNSRPIKQLGMCGTLVRLGSALRMIQSEVGRRYDFTDYPVPSMKSAGIGMDCYHVDDGGVWAMSIDDELHTAEQKTWRMRKANIVKVADQYVKFMCHLASLLFAVSSVAVSVPLADLNSKKGH